MAGRRFLYLAALCGCWIFYINYGEWFSYIALVAVIGLPWLSLLISLPAILRFRAEPAGPDALPIGTPGELMLRGRSRMPMPPFRGRLRLRSCVTGEQMRYNGKKGLPTDHCGAFQVTVEKVRVCDYLGLFSFPVRKKGQKYVLIRPRPVPVPGLADLSRYIARSWRPKFGGGYAENHELRLYRPGDNLNQVHWKLSAKTGKLILREPMEPVRGLVLLTMDLRGTPEELDRKFGRMLWLGYHLLEQGVAHELRVLTAEGVMALPVANEQELNKAIDRLLCAGAAGEGSVRDRSFQASWQRHIGGEPDEI